MFRKIHSNRDPEDTILTEIRKEFKIYFEKASKKITQILQRKPTTTFAAMIILLAFSAVLCFTICRNKEPAEKINKASKVNAVSDGFSQILSVSAAIKQSLDLKQQIDSLSAKKILSKTDSQTLIDDLDKLHQLNKPFHK
jgi:hypothetical protein